jgi:hypothetical protein
MDNQRKAEIRQWIMEANMALYRNNASDAYEALNQAAFAAGTCAIERLSKDRDIHPPPTEESVRALHAARHKLNSFEANSIECAVEQLDDTGNMTKRQSSFVGYLVRKYDRA